MTVALDHTRAPVAALLAGEIEVALFTTSISPARLVEEPLFSDEIVFVLSSAHPLAAPAAITARDLAE